MYENLGDESTLYIEFTGQKLDAHTLGVIQINLHEIIEKVAYRLLLDNELLDSHHYSLKVPYHFSRRRRHLRNRNRIIHAQISEIKIGSLYETITIMIPAALADPNVRAVLQGIAANVVFAIAASGVRGIVRKNKSIDIKLPPRNNDPFDIGPNLRDVLIAINTNPQPNGAEFTMKTTPEGGHEVSLRIHPTEEDD